MNIQENYPLQEHNTLSLQQSAAYFVRVSTVEELQQALKFYQEKFSGSDKPGYLVLGEGSNIVFSQDYPGLIIKNDIKGIQIVYNDNDGVELEVGACENWHNLVCYALKNRWYGLENLALIPGTAGAAPVQNIGAYGVELREVFVSAQVLDCEQGRLRCLDNAACEFGYRDSIFKHRPGRFIITHIRLRLKKSAAVNITYQTLQNHFAQKQMQTVNAEDVFDAVIQIRSSRLPDPAVLPNAGSFFKNPVVSLMHYQRLLETYPGLVAYPVEDKKSVKLAAAWLIDQAGWKGIHEEHVGVHAQQALVLVNLGGANGQELLAFADKIRRDIKDRYAIELEIEPTVV